MWTIDIWVLAGIVLRTLIVYTAVVLGLRLAGKREVGQITILDFVLLLLIANTVQNAMTGPDTSVNGGLVAAFTLLIADFLLMKIVLKNRSVEKFIEGSPTMLIYRGKIIRDHLKRENISLDELNEALREHAVVAVSEVALAVLEIDGSISVLKADEIPVSKRSRHRIKFIKRN